MRVERQLDLDLIILRRHLFRVFAMCKTLHRNVYLLLNVSVR